ncbi:MAG: DUF481 domain-containing protein [Microcystaceae cyanobacterium]
MASIIWVSCFLSLFALISHQKSAISTPLLPHLHPTSTDQVNAHNPSDILLIVEETDPQLSDIINLVNQMEDSPAKVNRLVDLARNAIQKRNIESAKEHLEQGVLITESFDNKVIQVDLLTNIAPYYTQINQPDKAHELLTLATKLTNSLEDFQTQSELLLEIALAYQSIGLEYKSQQLMSRSQELITKTAPSVTSFPFEEIPKELRFGLTGNINSFRDTTAFLGINTTYYKQWQTDDIYFDGSASVSFDSSRSVNNYRPSGTIITIYRHHFDEKWNFFTDGFIVTNQDLYSSRNDDEDLTIDVTGVLGAGLNLWRGESAKEFLDLQLGLGSRYEYDYIAFEERRNQVEPILAINLIGRGFKLGNVTLQEVFIISPSLRDPENTIIASDTRLQVPLSQRWSLTNRLFIRYRTQTIFEANPKVQFFFTTGVDYRF